MLLPLINDTSLANSTISSKTIFFIRGLTVLFGVWLLHFLFIKMDITQYKISKIDIFLFLIVCYITINIYVIQQYFGFSIRFIELIGLCFFYLILRSISIKTYLWLFLAIIVSGIIQAVYGNLQLLGYYASNHSGFRITGSFFNPGPYAGFLVTVWSIALGMYLFRESILKQFSLSEEKFSSILSKYIFGYVPLLGIISITFVLPATQSRASWLAVIISSTVLLELRYNILKKVINKITVFKKVLLLSSTLIIIGISLFGVYHLKQGSSDGRLFIWKISTEIIKESPLFGVGFDRFKAHYMNNQANHFDVHGETSEALVADNTYYAFNEFVQFTTENGIIGFLLLITVLLIIYKTGITKENKDLTIIIKTSLLAIGVFAFFSYPIEILPIKLIIVCLLAITAMLDSKKLLVYKNEKVNFQSPLFKTLLVVISFTTIIISTKYINNLNMGFKTWQSALSSYQYGDYESAIEEYEEAYPILKNNGDFLMNYGKALSIHKQDEKAIEILEQAKTHLNTTIIETALGDSYKNLKNYTKAEVAYKHAANMIPTRFYPLYLLAKLYEESGEKNKAVAIAKTILNKDVKVPSTAIKEIQLEMKNIIFKNDK